MYFVQKKFEFIKIVLLDFEKSDVLVNSHGVESFSTMHHPHSIFGAKTETTL